MSRVCCVCQLQGPGCSLVLWRQWCQQAAPCAACCAAGELLQGLAAGPDTGQACQGSSLMDAACAQHTYTHIQYMRCMHTANLVLLWGRMVSGLRAVQALMQAGPQCVLVVAAAGVAHRRRPAAGCPVLLGTVRTTLQLHLGAQWRTGCARTALQL